MKVLFVYQFATLGGVESVLRSRLEGLPAFGVDAHVWFLADGGGLDTFNGFKDRVQIGGPQGLVSFVDEFRPDVIASIDTEEVFRLPFEGKPAPVLIAECHSPYHENLGYLSRLGRYPVRALLVPSRHQRDTVLKIGRHEIPLIVVPNPIGEDFLREEIAPWQAPSGPVLAWIGRLDSLKDWESFLEIGSHVSRSIGEVQLWIVGDTREPSSARRLFRSAKDKGVLPILRWLRAVPYAEMPSLLATVRASGGLVVSTSRNESFGMAIAEAMASCCAVVAPRSGPFPELITDGVEGRLYQAGSESDAAEAVLDLLADPEARARLGVSARERILGSNATRKVMAVLADALRDVAKLTEAGETPDHPAATVEAEAEVRGSPPVPAPIDGLSACGSGQAPRNPSRRNAADREALFSSYYASEFWPGPGSTFEYTENIRKAVPRLLRRLGVRTMLDAPCGDYGWLGSVARDLDVAYIGGDIVADLIATNHKEFGSARTRFDVIDITSDVLPKVDLWLCRDCLFHFSNADIFSTLDNFLRSEIPFLLTTTHPECDENTDIPTGSFRLLNLEIAPFNFPNPIERIDDWIEGYPVRQLALWERASIARARDS